MSGMLTIMYGFFFGFALGVGCALAVMYTIWTGGYKRAVADSLLSEPPERFSAVREALQRRRSKATGA